MTKKTIFISLLVLFCIGLYTVILYICSWLPIGRSVEFQECQPNAIIYAQNSVFCLTILRTDYANYHTSEAVVHEQSNTSYLRSYTVAHNTGIDRVEWSDTGIRIFDKRTRTIDIPSSAFTIEQ